MKVNDAVLMAEDYVKQVYPREIHQTQKEESEQHFLMGMWAALQLGRQLPPDSVENLEKELRAYVEARVERLEQLQRQNNAN